MQSTRFETKHEVIAKPPKLHDTAISLLAVLLSFAVVVLYASIGRPIWLDELFQFAFGAFRSTGSAWHAIRHSIAGINFGQTGIYMLLDYWLLKVFGANSLALRLPSTLSAGLMLWGGLTFLRHRRFPAVWQLVLIVCYLGQASLMYFAGEARSYMPLAGASVGVFTYYQLTPAERRSHAVMVLGWVSILWGASMHPYFAFYWSSLFTFGYLTAVAEERTRFSLKAAFAHVNPPLLIAGAAIYFGIGAVTWIAHLRKIGLAPFQLLSKNKMYQTFVDGWHFQFLGKLGTIWIIVTVAVCLAHICLNRRTRRFIRPLLAPCLLVWLAMLLSLYVSYESYRHDYWILPRQWVASAALMPIAFTWFCAELVNLIGRVWTVGAWLIPMLCLCLIAAHAYSNALNQGHALLLAFKSKPPSQKFIPPPREALPSSSNGASEKTFYDTWVALANKNIEAGGPVSPVFQFFYQNYLRW
jgi:hypothetical protein